MESISRVRSLFEYNAASNGKSLEFALANPSSGGRAAKLVAHLIGADRMWLSRLELELEAPEPDMWPDIAENILADELDAVSGHWSRLLAGLSDEQLTSKKSYINIKGQEVAKQVQDILTTVLIHASYHRGQVAVLAGGDGVQAPSIDYIFSAP